MGTPELKYYDWQKTFSYNAYLNMIVTSRGRGKTYGLRKQCIADYIKDKFRFVEVVRYAAEIPDVCDGYFDKLVLKGEFPGYIFRTEGGKSNGKFFIAKQPEGEDERPKWELIGYCVALNAQQRKKKKTFANVKRIFFDEFILERRTYPGYLRDEYGMLLKLIDSVARQEAGQETPVRIYLCANACDLVNPYFVEFGIKDEPRPGYTWLQRGDVLLHYEIEEAYIEAKQDSLVGRLSRGHIGDMITNRFANASDDFIGAKPKDAKYKFAFVFQGATYAVWVSYLSGCYYICDKIPNKAQEIYALTLEDSSPNLLLAKRQNYKMSKLMEMFYLNAIRYDTPATREGFLKMCSLFGVR